jgi:predicted PurR-regulated permease PerM
MKIGQGIMMGGLLTVVLILFLFVLFVIYLYLDIDEWVERVASLFNCKPCSQYY